MLRRMLNSTRWRTRVTLWLAAALAGGAVVLFAKLAELALAGFAFLTADRPWVPFVLAPTIGMTAVWLSARFFPGTQGSGIPQVIAATKLAAHGADVGRLVSLRIAAGKIGVGAFALLGGFSAGREGPSVQVAASILHAAHRFLPNPRLLRASDLILAGGAAGVAAAFNTPLAGIVFAIEELGRRLETRTSGVLISTIVVAGLAAMAILGNYNYFGHLQVFAPGRSLLVPVLAGGVLCGLGGGLFSRLILLPQLMPQLRLWSWRRRRPILFAGACGLVVAALGWASGGLSYGSGYAVTQAAVGGELALPWTAALCRFFATAASYFSGIPGGLFAPALAIGGALGSSTAFLWGAAGDPVPVMALFMAGFLAAVTQSPITAAIIVMEMVDGHEMVISLLAVAFLAKVISARLSPELYQQLARGWRQP